MDGLRSDRELRAEDEIDETARDPDPDATLGETAEQDFATRNVMMSNALPTNAAAGAVIGSGGEMKLDPTTEEEDRDDLGGPPTR